MNRRSNGKTALTDKLSLSIEEVTSVTGFGKTTIYAAIRDKKLTARKAGRRTVVLREDLRSYLDALPTSDAA